MRILSNWLRRSRLPASRETGRAAILLYHRVTELSFDPQWLSVTPAQFAEHLRILRSGYQILSLAELCARAKEGSLPPRGVAITFDDGYADNLLEAGPVLEKFRAPATFFVATGKLDGQSEFWWDEVEGLLMQAAKTDPDLRLRIAGREHSWHFEDGETKASATDPGVRWNVTMPSIPSRAHQVYRELAPLLRDLDETERETILNDLARWANLPRRVRPSHRIMGPDQLVSLARGKRVEIGAHTVTHSVLALQSSSAQHHELNESKRTLERILGKPVTSFSYPFGSKADYTQETVRIAEEAGFERACSNFPGLAKHGVATYELPRFLVRDWDAENFKRQLESFFTETCEGDGH